MSISELFGLLPKCFNSALRFSYNTLASVWLIVSDVHKHLIVPAAACEEHLENGDLIPNFVSRNLDPLILTGQPSPQMQVGTNFGSISKIILFLQLLLIC